MTEKKKPKKIPMRDISGKIEIQLSARIPAKLDPERFLKDLSFTLTAYIDRAGHKIRTEAEAKHLENLCDITEEGPITEVSIDENDPIIDSDEYPIRTEGSPDEED